MKFIKKNRYTVILILVFILLLCLGLKVKEILMPDDQKASYGNRLDELDEHAIEESLYIKIKAELESQNNVSNVSYRLQGKIINFIITVTDSTNINDAKKIGSKVMEYFNDEQILYYTFQIYVKKEDASLNNFPIIGTKNPLTSTIIWTQDREISKEDDTDEK